LRRLAEANIEVHEYAAKHPDEVAKWRLDTLKPAGLSQQDLTEILASLVDHDHPIGQPLVDPDHGRRPETREGSRIVDGPEGLCRTRDGQSARLTRIDELERTLPRRSTASSKPFGRGLIAAAASPRPPFPTSRRAGSKGAALIKDSDICTLAKALCLGSHPRTLATYWTSAFFLGVGVLSFSLLMPSRGPQAS